jgi:hypothetical protein
VLIDTKPVHRLTRVAGIGRRIDGDRITGWARLRKLFDEIQAIAEALIAIVGAFPERAWQWPVRTG